jgi:hypothetical protein
LLTYVGFVIFMGSGRAIGSHFVAMPIAVRPAAYKGRIGKKKSVSKKRELERAEKYDPKRPKKCVLENGHRASPLVSLPQVVRFFDPA